MEEGSGRVERGRESVGKGDVRDREGWEGMRRKRMGVEEMGFRWKKHGFFFEGWKCVEIRSLVLPVWTRMKPGKWVEWKDR